MAEDDDDPGMVIKNHNVHFVTIGSKSFASRLSSDDDEYEYYQITNQLPNTIENRDKSLNSINEV